MKLPGLWAGLQGLCKPHHVVAPGPADELVMTDVLQVRRVLVELARLQNPVALQAADGRFMGGGVLAIDGVHGLQVHLQSKPVALSDETHWPVNATASSGRGLVLFTLHARPPQQPLRLCAAWPEQLIQVQSRRHFRLTALAGRRRRAWLSRPGSPERVPVHDLSEEGVGLVVPANHWPESAHPGEALLHLDDEVFPVPLLEVVHTRPGAKNGLGIVGARMLGLGEEQRRVLRRWLVAMQAAPGAGPAA